MSIFDLFSKRQKTLRGEVPDVFSYDTIPQALKVQIVHIWNDTIGSENEYLDSYHGTQRAYQFVVDTLCREYGVFTLMGSRDYGSRNYRTELANFLLQQADHEKILDATELSFRLIDRMTRTWEFLGRNNASELADSALDELNARLSTGLAIALKKVK